MKLEAIFKAGRIDLWEYDFKTNKAFYSREPGKGTTFKIHVPRFAGDVASKANPKEESAPAGKGETILLVEDEQSIRSSCRLFLEDLGYKVLEAAKPTTCLEMVERYSGDIHLLLTDVIMPEMDGRKLANQLCSVRQNLKVCSCPATRRVSLLSMAFWRKGYI